MYIWPLVVVFFNSNIILHDIVQTDWLAQHKQHSRKGRARRGLYLVLVLKFMVLVAFCIASHNTQRT